MQKIVRGFQAYKKIDVAGKRSSAIVIECAFRCYVARLTLAILQWEELQRLRAQVQELQSKLAATAAEADASAAASSGRVQQGRGCSFMG